MKAPFTRLVMFISTKTCLIPHHQKYFNRKFIHFSTHSTVIQLLLNKLQQLINLIFKSNNQLQQSVETLFQSQLLQQSTTQVSVQSISHQSSSSNHYQPVLEVKLVILFKPIMFKSIMVNIVIQENKNEIKSVKITARQTCMVSIQQLVYSRFKTQFYQTINTLRIVKSLLMTTIFLVAIILTSMHSFQ